MILVDVESYFLRLKVKRFIINNHSLSSSTHDYQKIQTLMEKLQNQSSEIPQHQGPALPLLC